ncbi:MAG: efflux RND transporter periplasmic adaptor subunit [Verrucomicrobia bacterium]|nr:efflux RND transporter periplasmic adaptor subunit [Verrucomicrobiota bacterium]
MKRNPFGQLGTAGAGLAACVGLVVLSGCKGRDDSHAHSGEVKTAQITAFGERHEVFAEHRLVVAGTPTKFVTHVTDLKTLEPRREGPVRFQMKLGQDAPIDQVERAPTRPGIYEAMLTFPKAGEWRVALVVPTNDGEKAIAFPQVRVFANAHETEHAAAPEAPEGISFLKEQQWQVLAGTETVTKRKLVEQLRLPALVAARPGSLAQVPPPVAGRLVLPAGKAMPLVGETVEAGQVLALIQPSFSEIGARFVEAEGEVVRARLALEQANLAFKRIEMLAKADAKSGRELQEAEFALKTAQARYDAAVALQSTYRQASANPGGQNGAASQPAIELRSPIAGMIISQSGAAVGEYVAAEKAMFTVLNAASVFIEARVPEASVKRLGTTKAASCEVPGETGQLIPITGAGAGRLVFVGIQVDAATRTVPLVYEARNPENRFRVGQSVNLFVESARAENTLAIPSAAIVEEDGRPIAFVQVGGETFQKRDLTLGIRDGNWVQILSGIAEGERVVTKGAYAVRLASVSSAIPAHGHVH